MVRQRKYYEVCPLAAAGSKNSVFTYHFDQNLQAGQLVVVMFGRRKTVGIVIEQSSKPKFITKPIDSTVPIILPAHLLKLAKWMSQYYATPLAKVLQTILPNQPQTRSRPRLEEERSTKHGVRKKQTKIILQQQQKEAIQQISGGKSQNYLLHGATASGKTQVYIELAKLALANNQSTLVLVPEISLTPQLMQSFQREFGKKVVLTHSGQTAAVRRLAWSECLESKEAKVIIGPRSALFMPVAILAYIIIDEAHETTYKQEQSPRYNAGDVANQLAALCEAKVVAGSATPSASDIYLTTKKHLQLVSMPQPVYQNVAKPPEIIDLGKKDLLKRSRFLSEPLLKALEQTLERGKQSILFMNRRGSARLALCGACDWVANCPNCHIPLTFHADQMLLRCHWCGYEAAPSAKCPVCNKPEVHFLGGGTKRVEQEVKQLLPKARIARLDRDSFDPKTINQLFLDLQSGKIDILIGTQMVTKGLDLPGVETIGIILADTMLYLPDFTASERTFQLLYQVRGRAGRREGTPAQTVIQTYSPKHPAIQAVVSGNYNSFIKNELADRQALHYPPFAYLLKLETVRASRDSAQKAADELANKLKVEYVKLKVEVLGPAPTWRETMGGKFHWQIICKSKNRDNLVKIAQNIPANWTFDLDPINLL